MQTRFEEVIASRGRVREIVSEPSPLVSHRIIDHDGERRI